MKAFQHVIADAYIRTLGLNLDDPPELWRFAFGKSEPLTPLTDEEKKKAKGIADRLRQLDPQFTVAPETYEQFKAELGTPTLCEAIQSLTNNNNSGDELAKRLSKLVALYNQPPMTREEYDQARKDSDLTTRLLIENWIQDPPGKNWPYDSFCYFSDRALAKMIYYIRNRYEKWLPTELRDKERERIAKAYRSLGLKPASPRVIKDIGLKSGKIDWIIFKKMIHRAV